MKTVFRYISVIIAFLLSVVIAIAAGFILACVDTGNTLKTVQAMTVTPTLESIQTQQVAIAGADIKDFVNPDDIKEGGRKEPLSKKLEDEGITSPTLGTEGTGDITNPGGNTNNSANGDAGTEVDANGGQDGENPDVTDAANEEPADVPVAITGEISSIPQIVKAGAQDDVIVNTQASSEQNVVTGTVTLDPYESYPLPFEPEKVPTSYFDDALFIGDSRVQGLGMYSKTNATFYAVTAFQLYKYKTFKVVPTPNGKVPIFEAMPYDRFTKIYIKVGLNELGTVSDEPFINTYTSLINELRVMQPRAIIYIQAILPVTATKSATDKTHCNPNIMKRNELLKNFAEMMHCYFVDVGPYFADETGALREDSTADGIHMYGKYMPMWIDALAENAVKWPQ